MKKYLYLLMLLVFGCTGKITLTEDDIGSDVLYSQDSYRPYSGKCIVVFRNTEIVKEQFTFKHGLLHGESIAWYKNGQMRRRGYYRKGEIDGKWEFWDENGNMTISVQYKEDKLADIGAIDQPAGN